MVNFLIELVKYSKCFKSKCVLQSKSFSKVLKVRVVFTFGKEDGGCVWKGTWVDDGLFLTQARVTQVGSLFHNPNCTFLYMLGMYFSKCIFFKNVPQNTCRNYELKKFSFELFSFISK